MCDVFCTSKFNRIVVLDNSQTAVFRDQALLACLQFSCCLLDLQQLLCICLDSCDGGVAAHHVLDGRVLEFAAVAESLFAVDIIRLNEILTFLC